MIKKTFKYFIFTLLIIVSISLTFNYKVNASDTTTSILNYDDSLGIFKDLTDEEIKEYYSDLTDGLKGDDLLSSLQPILKENQVKLNYNSGDTTSNTWSGYYLLERDYVKSPLTDEEISSQTYAKTDIWLDILYSSSDIYVDGSINSGSYQYYDDGTLTTSEFKSNSKQFDREHVFPKSFGFNGSKDKYKNYTAGCDMQNLHAGEHNGNSSGHSNYPYGNVKDKSSSTKITSGLTGEIVGYTGLNDDGITVFEPLDEDKGDIARTIFYMCARYHTYEMLSSSDESPALTLSNTAEAGSTIEPSATKDNPAAYGILDDLLKWNEEDTVSEFEIHRNNLCYNAIQYNRNPFIDYPSWANIAFKDSTSGIDLDTDKTSNSLYASGSNTNSNNESNTNNETNIDVTTNQMELNSTDNFIVNSNKIDTSIISFTITNENNEEITVNYSNVTYELTYNDEVIEVTDLSNYTFTTSGDYSITFKYTDSSSGIIYLKVIDFTINNNYSLSIDTSNVKKEYSMFDKLDLSSLVVSLYNNGVKESELDNYSITILNSNDEEVLDSSNSLLLMPGEYKVKVTYDIDNKTLSQVYSINVNISLTLCIILSVIAVIVLVVVIILIMKMNKRKHKRNRKHR